MAILTVSNVIFFKETESSQFDVAVGAGKVLLVPELLQSHNDFLENILVKILRHV